MLERRYLDVRRAARIREQLTHLGTFSRMLQELPLESGESWIFAPESVTESQLYAFDHDAPHNKYTEEMALLKTVIKDFLHADRSNACVFWDSTARPDSYLSSSSWIEWNNFGQEMYEIITAERYSDNYIDDLIGSQPTFSFVASLASFPHDWPLPEARTALTEEFFRIAVTATKHIIVTAYYDAGYLYWSREPSGGLGAEV